MPITIFINSLLSSVTLDQIGSRNQLPGFQESGLGKILMQIAGVATGIPLNMSNAKSKFTNFMGDQREKLTGYRTQQEYDDARQQRINENSIETILTRKPPITEAMQKRLTQLGCFEASIKDAILFGLNI